VIGAITRWLGGIGWLIGWRIARWIPEGWAYFGFERMSARTYRRDTRARRALHANLAPIMGDRTPEAVREGFRWYGRYWAETFRMQDLTPEELTARMRTFGLEHIEQAYAEGRGVILATPHLGNWDAGGRFVAERWPLTVVVEVLKPRIVFERFVAHRRAMGMTIVPLERGADPTARCIETVREGRVVALVADRDMSRSGVEVRMFGRVTTMPPGPAVVALRTDAPLIPAAIYQREDGTWFGHVLPALEKTDVDDPHAVPVLTQRLADAFATLIDAHPEQWHVFHPYWIDR